MNRAHILTSSLIILNLVAPSTAQAGEPGLYLSAGGMAFTNSSKQGGQGPEGSTLLTHSELLWSPNFWGRFWTLGAFAQWDKQGSNETDTAVGPKFELHWSVFYAEIGYAPFLQRAFTDRSIALQSGYGWYTGGGVRFFLTGGGPNGGPPATGLNPRLFIQFSYKYRTQVIKEQDGGSLDPRIVQRDGYPVFGLGVKF